MRSRVKHAAVFFIALTITYLVGVFVSETIVWIAVTLALAVHWFRSYDKQEDEMPIPNYWLDDKIRKIADDLMHERQGIDAVGNGWHSQTPAEVALSLRRVADELTKVSS